MDVAKNDTHQEWRHDLVRMIHRATRRIHLWDFLWRPTQPLVRIPQLEFVRELGERCEIRNAKGRCGGLEKPGVWRDGDGSQRREAARRTTPNGNTRAVDERIGISCEQLGRISAVLDVYDAPVFSKAGSETG